MSLPINDLPCLSLFINFVAGESADKKEVLNAFTEVYDIMYAIEDKHDAQIKELMEQDMAKTTKIEHLELQIQEQKVELNKTRAKLDEQKLGKNLCVFQRYTYRVLQTIQMKLIFLCV